MVRIELLFNKFNKCFDYTKELATLLRALTDLMKENLLLSGLIALIEHINSAGCINNFGLPV